MCVSARFSLTESEYARLPIAAYFVFELFVDQDQGKPTLKAKVVDRKGKEIVNSRMIAILERETKDGIYHTLSPCSSRLMFTRQHFRTSPEMWQASQFEYWK
jgi:hypothetical protein